MSSIVARVFSTPYLARSSRIRFSATRQDATWAFMSTQRASGMRVLMRIMFTTSMIGFSSL